MATEEGGLRICEGVRSSRKIPPNNCFVITVKSFLKRLGPPCVFQKALYANKTRLKDTEIQTEGIVCPRFDTECE